MIAIFRDEQGVALVTALITLVIVSMLGAAALTLAGGTINQTVWDRSTNEAFHIAESGFDKAVARIKNGETNITFKTGIGSGEASVTVISNGMVHKIRSVGAQPSFASPRSRRAIEAVILHLDPSQVFFSNSFGTDKAKGRLYGVASVQGPLYSRDAINMSGNSVLTGGPFFVKDDPATLSPTGDLVLGGSSSMGTVGSPVYLFIDGDYTPGSNLHTLEIFRDVPDLEMPVIDENAMPAQRNGANLVIDDDGVNNGSMNSVINSTKASERDLDTVEFTDNTDSTDIVSPDGLGRFKWDKASRTFTIRGKVFLDGDLQIVQGTGGTKKAFYTGSGTLVVYGNIGLLCGLEPTVLADWPETSAFGFITPKVADFSATSGAQIYAVVYAYKQFKVVKQLTFRGLATSQEMSLDNNPTLIFENELTDATMPEGTPEFDPFTAISGWREVQP